MRWAMGSANWACGRSVPRGFFLVAAVRDGVRCRGGVPTQDQAPIVVAEEQGA